MNQVHTLIWINLYGVLPIDLTHQMVTLQSTSGKGGWALASSVDALVPSLWGLTSISNVFVPHIHHLPLICHT